MLVMGRAGLQLKLLTPPGTSSTVGVTQAINRNGVILIRESVIITSQVGPVTVWANILPLFVFVKENKLRKPNK